MKKKMKTIATEDIALIRKALKRVLYVPDNRLKSNIIKELIKYLKLKFSDKDYRIRVFIAFKEEEISGFITCQIDPDYKSRNRICGTFGWLNAKNFEACKSLMEECEDFIKQYNIRLLRGNINFPKGLGGIGIQTLGFNEEMLYGVAFGDPRSKILDYLIELGYKQDAEYICLEVTTKEWKKGKVVDKYIKLRYLTFEEIVNRKEEILDLARSAFNVVMPDSTTGDSRFNEIMEIYSNVPDTFFKLKESFNFKKYSKIPEFIDDWESSNLENSITWAPFAIHRETDEIVGLILSLPDLYQLWLDEPITRCNVDTVMVKPGYTGSGIFSALNNIGQITLGFNGINYFEGTSIWNLNEDAICTIMPHCQINRRFVVFQKRIKKDN